MIYGIVLAGGSGKRLGAEIPKQYIEVNGRPLLYYTLKAFEDSAADAVAIVADEANMQFVVSGIVDKFGLKKVIRVCQGGAERFNSVLHGLDDLSSAAKDEDIVLIHDGARPFIKPEEINAMAKAAEENGAAIAAMPVKDTIKISDDEGFVAATTVRANTWQIQTPQAFRFGLIHEAYKRAAGMQWKAPGQSTAGSSGSSGEDLSPDGRQQGAGHPAEGKQQTEKAAEKPVLLDAGKIFTDDSMVIEALCPEQKIRLVPTSYENIKITTPEDLEVAKARL